MAQLDAFKELAKTACTKEDFIKLCQLHDYTYEYSDDSRWVYRGMDEARELKELSRKFPIAKAVITAYKEFWKTGEQEGCTKTSWEVAKHQLRIDLDNIQDAP